jgi:hypothetical protein
VQDVRAAHEYYTFTAGTINCRNTSGNDSDVINFLPHAARVGEYPQGEEVFDTSLADTPLPVPEQVRDVLPHPPAAVEGETWSVTVSALDLLQ